MDSAARHPASAALAVVLGLPRPIPAVVVWVAAMVTAYESGLVVPGRDRG
jgi:hypothetical protein